MSAKNKTLVVVESPAKAKTIKKYLGSGYEVVASKGHVKDLPKKLGIDVENGFKETYEVIDAKAKVLKELRDESKKATRLLLAMDPDREGEAIAWHIADELGRKSLDVARVEFHEITKRGVERGLASPRALDKNLYDAQRARRVLDRIVGYDVSALVWSKLAFGLSAGRVQSVALRLIVEREREIEAFVPEEYWNVAVALKGRENAAFVARLAKLDGEKAVVGDGESAAAIRADLDGAKYSVTKVTRREQKRSAPPPYNTSKLQQDAASYLRFAAKRTMSIAQRLYEGVDLKRDGGQVGLITYLRTDSVRVSADAISDVRAHIGARFGERFLPSKPNFFKARKNAQEAHEAIRPTSMDLSPDKVRKYLSPEQIKLYKMIWDRFVASQMAPAVYDQTSVEIDATPTRKDRRHERIELRASGRILKFSGWLEAHQAARDHTMAGEEDEDGSAAPGGEAHAAEDGAGSNGTARVKPEEDGDGVLPELTEGEALALVRPPGVTAEQKFTQPPPRYNEGSLVRELEKRGIGRPSTYAEIISKVQARDYVERLQGGQMKATELGKIVVDGLVATELDFMDPAFTATMEEDLDKVEAGKLERVKLLERFYAKFRKILDKAKKKKRWAPEPEPTEFVCDVCGGKMLKRWSRNGFFLGCENYPKCKTTSDLGDDGKPAVPKLADVDCDKCGKPMVVKTGRYGEFLSCSAYPACKNAKPVPLGVKCPACGGDMIEIRARKRGGRTFYGCGNYPKCEYKVWQKPVDAPCPACKHPFLVEGGGRRSPKLVCPRGKECGYSRALEEPDGEERSASRGTSAESSAGAQP